MYEMNVRINVCLNRKTDSICLCVTNQKVLMFIIYVFLV